MMPAPARPSLISGFLVSGVFLIGGWHVTQEYIHWHVWGLGMIALGFVLLIKQLLVFLGYFLQAAEQLNLLRESRTLSGMHGAARLARKTDPFIQALSKDTRGIFLGALEGLPLFYDPFAKGNGHMLVYAPSRTGKTVSLVIPALLHWFFGSVVVTDVKSAELLTLTAAWRRAMGQRIIILNPFGVLGIKGLRFNPLRILIDEILKNSGKRLSTLARAIAFHLIPKQLHDSGNGNFFRGGARRLIIAGLLYLAAFDPKHCNLPSLRTLIWRTSEEIREIAAQMQGVNWFGGLLRDYANALAEMLEPQYIKTYGAFRDNAMEVLEIYEAGSDMGEAVSESDFAPEDILDGKTTVYLILPESEIETHGSWMGLIVTILFETIAAMQKPSPILMLLEEMGNLGRIPNITKALSLLPGKGVRSLMVFQSRRQPTEIYGRNVAAIIEEQSSCVQAWSIRSEEDRKAWSARIGTTTKKARSLSRDPHDQAAPWRLSVSERAAPVLPPDEIGRLPGSYQLIALDGEPVILATKVPYYTVPDWRKAAGENPYAPDAQGNARGKS